MGRAALKDGLLLAAWLLLTIGLRPLLLPDEGRYAGVALEMLHGSLLVPTLDGLPFFHKPPLLYWLDIASMRLFGINDFAVRMGPSLLAWAMAMALRAHLLRWHGAQVARVGLVVLATTPFFFVGAQYVNHDIGVAACITGTVLAWVRAVDEPRSLRWALVGWACAALGVLAKGLIGVVLPVMVLVPWLLVQRRWTGLRLLAHPLGLVCFATLVLPWMWAMQARYPDFFDYFIVEQHFRRYAGAAFNNRAPFWFFPVVVPLLMLPWSLWLWPALRQRGARAGLYLWWVAVVLGFFSLPSSKLVGYALPALAPLAALLALVLTGRRWKPVAATSAVWCLALIAGLAWRAPGSHRDVALALRERLQPGDAVVFVEQYFYDLPFYAGLRAPVPVVSDWADAEIPLHDNWRKELHDAARFAPDGGASVLWPWARLVGWQCGTGRLWLVTSGETVPRLPALRGLAVAMQGRHAVLMSACGVASP